MARLTQEVVQTSSARAPVHPHLYTCPLGPNGGRQHVGVEHAQHDSGRIWNLCQGRDRSVHAVFQQDAPVLELGCNVWRAIADKGDTREKMRVLTLKERSVWVL